jgi:hypothetical protein
MTTLSLKRKSASDDEEKWNLILSLESYRRYGAEWLYDSREGPGCSELEKM